MEGEPRGEHSEHALISRERRLEIIGVGVDLMLQRCLRTKMQPRELLLMALEPKRLKPIYGAENTETILNQVHALPDFDVNDPVELEHARAALKALSQQFVMFEEDPAVAASVQDFFSEAVEQMNHVGLFETEIEERPDGRVLRLHIPPTTSRPGLHELRASLRLVADALAKDPTLFEVHMSSLLLEHPIAARFGFTIVKDVDRGAVPHSAMSREEFLRRFAGEQK